MRLDVVVECSQVVQTFLIVGYGNRSSGHQIATFHRLWESDDASYAGRVAHQRDQSIEA